MPKPGCNGYSMFAEQMRPSLEEKLGKKLFHFIDLIRAAAPYWKGLPEEEKLHWKERARDYKKSDEFLARKKTMRMRKYDRRIFLQKRRGNADDADSDFDSDDNFQENDFDEPMELPGPVQKFPLQSTEEIVEDRQNSALIIGVVNGIDLVDNKNYIKNEVVAKLLEQCTIISDKPLNGVNKSSHHLISSNSIVSCRTTAGWKRRKGKAIPPRFLTSRSSDASVVTTASISSQLDSEEFEPLEADNFRMTTCSTCNCFDVSSDNPSSACSASQRSHSKGSNSRSSKVTWKLDNNEPAESEGDEEDSDSSYATPSPSTSHSVVKRRSCASLEKEFRAIELSGSNSTPSSMSHYTSAQEDLPSNTNSHVRPSLSDILNCNDQLSSDDTFSSD